MLNMQFLNSRIGKEIEITKNGLLSQSFKTVDNGFIVEGIRQGGGFAVGTTYYKVIENGITEIIYDLEKVYIKLQDYIINKMGINPLNTK